jgi:hypothetical protein
VIRIGVLLAALASGFRYPDPAVDPAQSDAHGRLSAADLDSDSVLLHAPRRRDVNAMPLERGMSGTGTSSLSKARYRRVMRHRGHKKAVVAVAHAMLRSIYHLPAEGTAYRDPGPDTTTAAMRTGSPATRSNSWNARAIGSWNLRPDRERPITGMIF